MPPVRRGVLGLPVTQVRRDLRGHSVPGQQDRSVFRVLPVRRDALDRKERPELSAQREAPVPQVALEQQDHPEQRGRQDLSEQVPPDLSLRRCRDNGSSTVELPLLRIQVQLRNRLLRLPHSLHRALTLP